jgi:hypothetical protein
MRTNLLSLFALVTINLSAQEYVPLLNEDHTWKQIIFGWSTYSQEIKIEGDTSIGEFTYKKIYAATEPFWDVWYFQGAYREDVAEQTIYKWNGTFDDIIYDFSVEEGESFTISPMGVPVNMLVNSTGTITINNVIRKTITFVNNWFTETWIVGVGSSLGVLNPSSNYDDFSPALTCFYIGNNLAYDNPNEDTQCGLFLSDGEITPSSISVFPNPAQRLFKIELPFGYQTASTEIIDAKGALVISYPSLPLNNEIDISTLSNGLYYIKLILESETVKVIPLIKQFNPGD